MYDATKLADPTRPVLDASGYSHRVRGADIYDSHSYEQDPQRFREEQAGLAEGRPHANRVHLGPDDMPFADGSFSLRSEEHTSELQSRGHLVCRLLLEKKKNRMMH